jgi:hypothetical protein
LTGSGTNIGISPIIGHGFFSDIIQPENVRPLHPQASALTARTVTNVQPFLHKEA